MAYKQALDLQRFMVGLSSLFSDSFSIITHVSFFAVCCKHLGYHPNPIAGGNAPTYHPHGVLSQTMQSATFGQHGSIPQAVQSDIEKLLNQI